MKFTITSLFILLLIPNIQGQISVGGRVGANISNVATNGTTGNEKSKTGFHVGVIGSMPISKSGKLSVVGELVLNQKGGVNFVSGTNSSFYIELPVMLRYAFSITESFPMKVFINGGPYIGVMASRTADGGPDLKSPNKDASNIMEFGLAGGGGLMYPLGPGSLFVEARHTFGLTNMVSSTLERNYFTSISIGYLYMLAGKSQEDQDKTIQGGFE